MGGRVGGAEGSSGQKKCIKARSRERADGEVGSMKQDEIELPRVIE